MNVRTVSIFRRREGITLLRTAAAGAAAFALSAGYAGGTPAMLNAALAAAFPAYAAPIFAASAVFLHSQISSKSACWRGSRFPFTA